jgi:hypothetical protein
VEGDWELVSPDGRILDRDVDPTQRDVYRVHVILSRDVVGYEVAAPESFTLHFDSGHTLRVFDSSKRWGVVLHSTGRRLHLTRGVTQGIVAGEATSSRREL